MITLLLLALIYFAFISLGLPDALLGVAWPVIQVGWKLPIDAVGIISFVITIGTVISSTFSSKIIKIFGTGKIVAISCAMTSLALLGISIAPSFVWLILLSIPLGLGAGAVDSALNNYVALHFKAHHMNWLHSFWGVGASAGPLIMANALLMQSTWRGGYRTVGLIQLALTILLVVSLPLWKKHKVLIDVDDNQSDESEHVGRIPVLKIKCVKPVLATFLVYCAMELSVGLWGSSYLVQARNIPVEKAALWVSVYYGGITIGRFISGFVSFKLSNTKLIRYGVIISSIGVLLLVVQIYDQMLFLAFMLIGLGLAPIFPSMLHETPVRFGKAYSQDIIGLQMACAYIGSAVFPPLFGILAKQTSMVIFPFYLLACVIMLIMLTESTVKNIKKHSSV